MKGTSLNSCKLLPIHPKQQRHHQAWANQSHDAHHGLYYQYGLQRTASMGRSYHLAQQKHSLMSIMIIKHETTTES